MCIYFYWLFFYSYTEQQEILLLSKKKEEAKKKKCEITDEGLKPHFNYCHTKHNNSHRQRFNN